MRVMSIILNFLLLLVCLAQVQSQGQAKHHAASYLRRNFKTQNYKSNIPERGLSHTKRRPEQINRFYKNQWRNKNIYNHEKRAPQFNSSKLRNSGGKSEFIYGQKKPINYELWYPKSYYHRSNQISGTRRGPEPDKSKNELENDETEEESEESEPTETESEEDSIQSGILHFPDDYDLKLLDQLQAKNSQEENGDWKGSKNKTRAKLIRTLLDASDRQETQQLQNCIDISVAVTIKQGSKHPPKLLLQVPICPQNLTEDDSIEQLQPAKTQNYPEVKKSNVEYAEGTENLERSTEIVTPGTESVIPKLKMVEVDEEGTKHTVRLHTGKFRGQFPGSKPLIAEKNVTESTKQKNQVDDYVSDKATSKATDEKIGHSKKAPDINEADDESTKIQNETNKTKYSALNETVDVLDQNSNQNVNNTQIPNILETSAEVWEVKYGDSTTEIVAEIQRRNAQDNALVKGKNFHEKTDKTAKVNPRKEASTNKKARRELSQTQGKNNTETKTSTFQLQEPKLLVNKRFLNSVFQGYPNDEEIHREKSVVKRSTEFPLRKKSISPRDYQRTNRQSYDEDYWLPTKNRIMN